MAHLLIIEAPGGDDFDIVTTALEQGHHVSFLSADLNYYQQKRGLQGYLQQIHQLIEIKPFNYPAVEQAVLALHAQQAIDAILCLIDIRMIEAAKLAERLQLAFLNVDTATMLRDKFTVRSILARHGIPQPEFSLATSNQQLRDAVSGMGLPLLIKPCDGYGSQNIAILLNDEDLNPLLDPLDYYLPCQTDYGFGVKANDRLIVERYIVGQLIGCDTFSYNGQHTMLGINEKLMFTPPSCAIRGSCFPAEAYDTAIIERYVFSVLDALHIDIGATHSEILLSDQGPLLVEVNPRLVGAKIPRLLNLALHCSIHSALIDLHLGKNPLTQLNKQPIKGFAVSRWIISTENGVLDEIILPPRPTEIVHLEILKHPGDMVSYPYQNADRLGYIMVLGQTRQQAEQIADVFISQVKVKLLV